jgi:hypothetical protein
MSKASELLKHAVARREEASARRSLARMTVAGELHRQLQTQAHELERVAVELEKEAALLQPKGHRPGNARACSRCPPLSR